MLYLEFMYRGDKAMPTHIVISVILFIVVLVLKDYKNWKKYYNTILFFNFGAIMYEFLFYTNKLWIYQSPFFSSKILTLIWLFTMFPYTVLLFLSHYPEHKPLARKIAYSLSWTILYAFLEYILYVTRRITYHNGWNYLYSCFFDLNLFPILRIHHIKPLLSILICVVWVIIAMTFFKVPITI